MKSLFRDGLCSLCFSFRTEQNMYLGTKPVNCDLMRMSVKSYYMKFNNFDGKPSFSHTILYLFREVLLWEKISIEAVVGSVRNMLGDSALNGFWTCSLSDFFVFFAW